MRITLLLLFVFLSHRSFTQQDTVYYYSYKSKVTARLYVSNKSTAFLMRNIDGLYKVNYRPNTTRNLGIGATYKSVTLNLAYGFGFLNPDVGRGKTKYLDLQFHRYGRKLIFDVFGQFYRGYYMYPKGYGTTDKTYYVRPDLSINMVGGSMQYVFNHKKFSYRASFLLNEWQRRSAGTFLVGFETYFGNIKSDSTMFPTILNREVAEKNYREIEFFELGPNAGYAYTFVIKKHFFLTGAVSAGVDFGSMLIHKDTEERTSGVSTNILFRASAGYNAYLWAIGFFYVSNNVHLPYHTSAERVQLNTAMFRLNYVRRFMPGKKVKKYLKVLE